MFRRLSCAFLLCAAGSLAAAEERAAVFLGKGYRSCDAFFEAVAAETFSDAPVFFLCHKYDYKPYLMYGYIRDHGADTFSMTLVKNRRVTCTGRGDLVWSGPRRSRSGSASGRFECGDGAEGGYAFEVETVDVAGQKVLAGTIFGGIDENGTSGRDEEIHADFYVFSQPAVIAIGRQR